MNVHTAVIPDKRRALENYKYPIKLRVTFNRQRRYYSISHERREGVDFMVTDDEWELVNSNSPRGRYKKISVLKSQIITEADEIISKIIPFNFEEFKNAYEFKNKRSTFKISDQFKEYIETLAKEGRVSSYKSHQDAMKSFEKHGLPDSFERITKDDLAQYERSMLDMGRSITTVGIYLRNLRTIFNKAIKENITENYPFSDYKIPIGLNKKKALDRNQIGKIAKYNLKEFSGADKARDIFILSYYCNGINVTDICNLRCSDINLKTMEITYERQKSRRKRIKTKIIIDILPEVLSILKKWGNLDGQKNDYVFPFFKDGLTPEQKKNVTQGIIKRTNKHMKKICSDLGIPVDATTYYARHSFANILKQSGAPHEFISETLGHSEVKITSNYLKSFESEFRKKWVNNLVPDDTD